MCPETSFKEVWTLNHSPYKIYLAFWRLLINWWPWFLLLPGWKWHPRCSWTSWWGRKKRSKWWTWAEWSTWYPWRKGELWYTTFWAKTETAISEVQNTSRRNLAPYLFSANSRCKTGLQNRGEFLSSFSSELQLLDLSQLEIN